MIEKLNLITDYKNDLYFKFLMNNDQDPQCIYMLKLFIENILNIECDEITVLNPELNPKNVKDKDMILDIRVKTKAGDIINVEMQNSRFSMNQYYRFQSYGATLLSSQNHRGDKDYVKNVHPIYQIIFIDDIDKDNMKLIDTYESRNIDGKKEKYNLITRTYVQLPFIDVIASQKALNHFTPLEVALYIFKNGMTSDIIGIRNQEVIAIMKDKMDKFNKDEELRLAAIHRQLNIMAHEGEKQEAFDNGKVEGFQQGELCRVKKFIQSRYGIVEEKWLLSLNEKQLESINEIIFKEDNYDVFKQKVNAVKETE